MNQIIQLEISFMNFNLSHTNEQSHKLRFKNDKNDNVMLHFEINI
jgi:hypothetical protein